MTPDTLHDSAIVVILLAIVAWLALSVGTAHASTYQGAEVRPGDALTLARCCYGESGADLATCTAQMGVIARTAARRGISMGAQASAYSSALRHPRRAWVPRLHTGPTPPEGWQRGSWQRTRRRFALVLANVRAELAADKAPPCPTAEHFGGRMDAHRMRAWRRVCVDIDRTRPVQMFWAAQIPRGIE